MKNCTIETRIYENNGGGLSAVVRYGGTVTGVYGGFEDGMISTADFISAAKEGFPYADSYDPDNWSGLSMEEASASIEDGRPGYFEGDDLVAIITPESVTTYPDRMGTAARTLFGVDSNYVTAYAHRKISTLHYNELMRQKFKDQKEAQIMRVIHLYKNNFITTDEAMRLISEV